LAPGGEASALALGRLFRPEFSIALALLFFGFEQMKAV
jgi:hypothetical protein